MGANKMDAESYETWPVFFGVRDDESFIKEFERVYARKFVPAGESRRSFLGLVEASGRLEEGTEENDKEAGGEDGVQRIKIAETTMH